jgi:tRNA (guanine37-N1)-methyltransferase
MTVEQWGVRVPTRHGEPTRQALIGEGVLDVTLKVLHDGDGLVFPVLEERDGAAWYAFEEQPGRIELPRHEQVGGIAIMQENDPTGAALILASRPSLHTVLFPTSEVAGEYRTRTYAVLAGTDTTRTEVVEHGHRFAVDLAGAYFSARLSTERQRVFDQVQEHELVLDMFAGVGPFAITLAPRAALVMAADLNSQAILLMIENIGKNRSRNVIPLLADARRLEKCLPWKFDRIIMNLPLAGTEFLPEAFRLVRPGGTIHFYSLVSKEGEHLARIKELGGVEVTEHEVRSYSPGQWHAVYDIVAG